MLKIVGCYGECGRAGGGWRKNFIRGSTSLEVLNAEQCRRSDNGITRNEEIWGEVRREGATEACEVRGEKGTYCSYTIRQWSGALTARPRRLFPRAFVSSFRLPRSVACSALGHSPIWTLDPDSVQASSKSYQRSLAACPACSDPFKRLLCPRASSSSSMAVMAPPPPLRPLRASGLGGMRPGGRRVSPAHAHRPGLFSAARLARVFLHG